MRLFLPVKSTIQMFSLPSQVAQTDSSLLCVVHLRLETAPPKYSRVESCFHLGLNFKQVS